MKTTLTYPNGTKVTIKSKDEKLAFELAQEAKKKMAQRDVINKVEKIEPIDM